MTLGAQLRAKYGEPERFDVTTAVRLLGAEDGPAANDCFAWTYASEEAAEAFAAANREMGHRVWRVPTEDAVVNLVEVLVPSKASR